MKAYLASITGNLQYIQDRDLLLKPLYPQGCMA